MSKIFECVVVDDFTDTSESDIQIEIGNERKNIKLYRYTYKVLYELIYNQIKPVLSFWDEKPKVTKRTIAFFKKSKENETSKSFSLLPSPGLRTKQNILLCKATLYNIVGKDANKLKWIRLDNAKKVI